MNLVDHPASPDIPKSCHRGPALRDAKSPIALAMNNLASLALNHADGDLIYRYLLAGPLVWPGETVEDAKHTNLYDFVDIVFSMGGLVFWFGGWGLLALGKQKLAYIYEQET